MAELDAAKRKLGRNVDLSLLTMFKLMSVRMFGDFQSERLAAQVGEAMGAELASGVDAKEVPKAIAELIGEFRLGSVKFEIPKEKGERFASLGIFRVAESAETYGLGKAEKPVCGLIRGIIRGALTTAYHQENISVRETRCAALGEKECEFEARWVPM